MSEEEEIIQKLPPEPPPPAGRAPARLVLGVPLTSDAGLVLRKASTWLAVASASSGAGLAAYAILPGRAQALFPDWALIAMSVVAVGSALAVPLATSIRQKAPRR